MNKKAFLLAVGSILALASCNSVAIDASSKPTPVASSDSDADDPILAKIENYLSEYSGDNITYRGEVLFYAYPIGSPLDIINLDSYVTTAKYADGQFGFEAKITGSDSIYTEYTLIRNEDGYAAYPHLNLQGKAEETLALSDNGNPIEWDASIYRNLLGYISKDDLALADNGRYRLSSDDASSLLSDIATAATYTSSLPASRIDYGDFFLKGNGSLALLIQEKETTEVYEGYYYGRTITLTFSDIGTTSIEKITDLPEKTENEPLKKALDAIQNATNYTCTIKGVTEGSEILYEKDEFAEGGFLRTLLTDDGLDFAYSGQATVSGAACEFVSNDLDRLIGKPIGDNALARPSFGFSSNLFTLEGSDDGIYAFSVFNYPEVLDYVSLDMNLSGSFYNGFEESILFNVQNETLVSIEIPAYLSSQDGNAQKGTLLVEYGSIGTTDITNSLTSVIAYDNASSYASFDEIRVSNNEKGYTNVKEVFESIIGTPNDQEFPFFVPGSIKRLEECSLGVSEDEDPFLIMAAPSGDHASETELENVREALRSAGWSVNGKSFSDGVRFTKAFDGAEVEIIIIDSMSDGMEIPFEATISYEIYENPSQNRH